MNPQHDHDYITIFNCHKIVSVCSKGADVGVLLRRIFSDSPASFTSNGQKISLPHGTMLLMMGGTKLEPATDLEMNLTTITTSVMMEIR